MKRDAIVIGAGHNGLTAAATLARAGRSVLVVEARDEVGGLAEHLFDDGHVRRWVVTSLELERHGLAWEEDPPGVHVLEPRGPGLVLSDDPQRTRAAIAERSAGDADGWSRWRETVARLRGFVERVLNERPPDPDPRSPAALWDLARSGLALRRLGEMDMAELLRIAPMCVADWVGEHFEDPLLAGALAAPAVLGTFTGPWSPGSAAQLLFQECTRGPHVRGGGRALVDALAASARAAGCEIRTSARVRALLVDDGAVRGVELEDGERLEAAVVASACDPRKTLFDLVPMRALPARLAERMRTWRMRGTTAVAKLTVATPPAFAAARIAGNVDDLERAFDAAKYGRFSDEPYLEMRAAGSTLSVLVHFAPHALKGGWTDEQRDALKERVLARLESCLPDLAITDARVLTPLDLETEYGLSGGHPHHGEHALDQLLHLRPDPSCARYATPVRGLFLCGSGSHPGGGLTCAPGSLGARAILER